MSSFESSLLTHTYIVTMSTQNTEAIITLKGMFPDVDPEVCEAVFEANQANLEQSINALLSMSDPNYKSEENIPAQTEVCCITFKLAFLRFFL